MRDLGSKILIFAKKEGTSHIVSGNLNYEINVLNSKTYQVFRKIQDTLKHFLGIKVKMEDSQIVVFGHLLRFSDWKDISKALTSISASFKAPPYSFQASMDLDIKNESLNFFKKKILSLGRLWSNSNFNLDSKTIELSKEEKSDETFWKSFFYSYGLQLQFLEKKVSLTPMIKIQIHIVEISKSWQKQIGFKWPESLKAQILPPLLSKENLFLQLQALENKGEGQILASPNIICRSGSKASFLAGGEFPIKTSGYKNGKVTWKPHGVHLSVKPLAEMNGHMNIELSAEVSLIDNAQSINGIPALKTNRISSHFNLKRKTTIALSGLILKDFGQSTDQTPHLAKIPLLGRLFQSKNFKEQKSELVIFVTPEVLPTL